MKNLTSGGVFGPTVAVLFIILASCGGNVQEPSPSTPERVLLVRAQEALRAASAGTWAELHQYTSPRSRALCGLEGYAARVDNYLGLVRGFMAVGDEALFELRAAYATVNGDEGFVDISFFAKGKPVLFEEDEQVRWVSLDGEWWLEDKAWQDGCVGWKLFD